MGYRRKGFQNDDVRVRRTRVVSTRMDDVTLAKLSMALDNENVPVSSLSELVYLSCRALVGVAQLDDHEMMIDEARYYLSERFNIPVDPPGQSNTAYSKQMQAEQAWKDSGRTVGMGLPKLNARRPTDYYVPRNGISDEDLTNEGIERALKLARDKYQEQHNPKPKQERVLTPEMIERNKMFEELNNKRVQLENELGNMTPEELDVNKDKIQELKQINHEMQQLVAAPPVITTTNENNSGEYNDGMEV